MMKTFCSLCGIEICGALQEFHNLPRIEEKRRTIKGEEVNIMVWISAKISSGFLCADCRQMYIEKMLLAIATTRKSIK